MGRRQSSNCLSQEGGFAIEKITWAVNHLRNLSPLWDMFKEGIDVNAIEWQNH